MRRRFFRGPGDYLALAFVVALMATMLSVLAYTKGVTDARLAAERACRDRWECAAQAKGYEIVRLRGR